MAIARPTVVLASTSRYRRELLGRLRIPFEVAAPGVDEAERAGEAPADRALRLAIEKAGAVAAGRTNALVIGSDQVAALGNTILDKPGTFERAFEQLQRARGGRLIVHTAVAVIDTRDQRTRTASVPYDVKFREASDAEIERYLRTEEPYDCAASTKSEGLAVTLMEWMRGDDPTALVGLPLIEVSRMLREAGLLLP